MNHLTPADVHTLFRRLSGDRRQFAVRLLASRTGASAAAIDAWERNPDKEPLSQEAFEVARAYVSGNVVQNAAGDWIIRPLRAGAPVLLGVRPAPVPRSNTVHVAGEVVGQCTIERGPKRGADMPEISELKAGQIREAEAADMLERKKNAAKHRAGFGQRVREAVPLWGNRIVGNG
ncbi:hypothetical protein SAMN05444149_1013 [Pseudosulfitobacter pseudonitzschiae]|uniref:Uncharacterized protein n=1 Tax=Pseudosulfitobacter pseudonitzschiae TaxID=1402135 RepID=A0A073JKP7_9RHOB|nr:hypothetical protein [Pseudosulfitobacter pseudonitzschiae]KEJ98277.1 hypothetical protein SUH3_04595 [Pseudosulfitobacter pseudonitzschiae]SHE40262.1 hypothetical protein SAMN05444149_1013 [Pseudosulfitobacter pseudonitzschiae]